MDSQLDLMGNMANMGYKMASGGLGKVAPLKSSSQQHNLLSYPCNLVPSTPPPSLSIYKQIGDGFVNTGEVWSIQ